MDSIYGRGPEDQPYLYEHGGERPTKFTGKLLVASPDEGKFKDLPRNEEKRAIIGDMRNDENAIVAQLHLAFILAHNKLVDNATGSGHERFDLARRTLTWLYQWIVWNDFLKRVTKDDIRAKALEKVLVLGAGTSWKLGFDNIFSWHNQPFMPVEFSVAAYRFGHSMVRNSYRTNISDGGLKKFIPIFSSNDEPDDLRGFRSLNLRRVVQWDWFLDIESKAGFPQQARKIDTFLCNALAELPQGGGIQNILAARNLMRGVNMEVPSGPNVASHLGIEPIKLDKEEPESLWFYTLKEASVQENGERLGHLGSLLVCAVMAGLLKGDPRSWINMSPNWTPDEDPLLKEAFSEQDSELDGTLASIIRLSGLPVSGEDIKRLE